jgi:hypothetical protein
MITVRMLINRLPQALASAHIEERNGKKNQGEKQHEKVPHDAPFFKRRPEKGPSEQASS